MRKLNANLKVLLSAVVVFSACATPTPMREGEVVNPVYRDRMETALRSNIQGFRACFEHSHTLAAEQTDVGKVLIAWTISASGRVLHPKVVQTSMNNPRIEKCLLDELEVVDFPSAHDPIDVQFPFNHHF
jgi:hypothetical protein